MNNTNFSAKEPSLGYYYQLRLGLYLILKSQKSNAIIKIESLDDIVVDNLDNMDLFQTKLHINSVANLTDSSSDFWKTIRVWSENIINGYVDEKSTLFTLMTTAKIGDNSFIQDLKPELVIRDSGKILKAMLKVTEESTSQTNAAGYSSFNQLTENQQIDLINNITVIDQTLSIDESLKSLHSELKYSTHPKKLESLIERLEGWWFQKCIIMLQGNIDYISQEEVRIKIAGINDTLKEDNLPDDFGNPIEIDEESLENYQDRLFVSQLKLVAVKSNVLRNAINDFHRAFKQRSKWLREELTSINDEEAFERKLEDHWNNIFSLMKDDCEGMDKAVLQKVGYDFYKKFYVEQVPPIKIRERFTSEYLTRGSCHMLADIKKIGWHPEFDNLL
ncbi:ABC-three component system protein [Pedobacter glucosidilyticus]|uniref:ABC-three component system protein n=1 Tax=Pedobacter glucosidilyticus TaxID=1122941 RepID=UPI0026EEEE6A|nr:ABC-three component system protein [Pedobacter glucosidilyticus]